MQPELPEPFSEQLDRLEIELAELQAQYERLSSANTNLSNATHNLQAENEWLKTNLAKLQTDYEALRNSRTVRLAGLVSGIFKRLAGRPSALPSAVASSEVVSGQTATPVEAANDPEDQRYRKWIAANEPGECELEAQPAAASRFAYWPLISIITPVFNPDPADLEAAILSVREQTYPNWELCLADGGSGRAGVRETLVWAVAQDPRIKVRFLERNAGIAVNSNQALAMAGGEYCALLDHDDTLAPDALFEVAALLNRQSDLDFIFSDHDLLSADGRARFQPLFKPGYSAALLLSANYLTHLTVIRTTCLRQVKGFRTGYEGAQDWDLFLRLLEMKLKAQHIPRILYHWRVAPTSTAQDAGVKPLARTAQLNAIQAHLQRQNYPAEVYFEPGGFTRLRWRFATAPLVSIIIECGSRPDLLEPCLRAVLEITAYRNFEILLVDNGSGAGLMTELFDSLSRLENIKIIRTSGKNWSLIRNQAAGQAGGALLVFLDCRVVPANPEWLEELAGWAQALDVAICGGKMLNATGRIWSAGLQITPDWQVRRGLAGSEDGPMTPEGPAGWYRECLAVSEGCLLVRRDVFEQLGGFEASFGSRLAGVDLCLRARQAGYRVIYNPYAAFTYRIGPSSAAGPTPAELDLARRRWPALLPEGDPYLNPNLLAY